jgi:hypothetical protein
VSTNPLSGTTVQDLARTLMASFDTNKDGQLTADEFGGFLSKLLSGVQQAATTNSALGNTANFRLGAAGGSGAVRFEGFDFNAVNDLSMSAKYAFASAAQRAGTMPHTKSEAESWFNANIRGEMERLGHRINWVKGDKFQYTNWQGTFVVDFIRGADGPDPAVQWLVE